MIVLVTHECQVTRRLKLNELGQAVVSQPTSEKYLERKELILGMSIRERILESGPYTVRVSDVCMHYTKNIFRESPS